MSDPNDKNQQPLLKKSIIPTQPTSLPLPQCTPTYLQSSSSSSFDQSYLRTNSGHIIDNDNTSARLTSFGPIPLSDHILREKITHFDHERIPERVVHARGFGFHGQFKRNMDIDFTSLSDLCLLHLPQDETVPIFVRYSTVGGPLGSTDTPRDVRGFALRFYTEDGNFDIVGNDINVFFINDPMKFPDLVHAVKNEPKRGIPTAATAHNTFYDFISKHLESSHTYLQAMSPRGLPLQYYHMNGFGIHTFRLIKQQQEQQQPQITNIKFILKPKRGLSSFSWDLAQLTSGKNPDFNRQSMFELIENIDKKKSNHINTNDNQQSQHEQQEHNSTIKQQKQQHIDGEYIEFDLCIQLLPREDIMLSVYNINILDATQNVPEELFPAYCIGTIELNTNVSNEFSEIEQIAFCPSNLIPGIDIHHGDALIQGRLFSYLDTQISRLGVNFQQLPINYPHGIVQHLNNQHMLQQLSSQSQSSPPSSTTPPISKCPLFNNHGHYKFNNYKDGKLQQQIPLSNVLYEPNSSTLNLLHGGIDICNQGILTKQFHYNPQCDPHGILSFNNDNNTPQQQQQQPTITKCPITSQSSSLTSKCPFQDQHKQDHHQQQPTIFTLHNTIPTINYLDQWLSYFYHETSSAPINPVQHQHHNNKSLLTSFTSSKSTHPLFKNYFQQPRAFYYSLSQYEQSQVISAISFELNQCTSNDIKLQFIYSMLCNIDINLATMVYRSLNLSPNQDLDINYIQKSFQHYHQHLIPYQKHLFFNSNNSHHDGDNNNTTNTTDEATHLENFLLNQIFYTLLSTSPSQSFQFNSKDYLHNDITNINNATSSSSSTTTDTQSTTQQDALEEHHPNPIINSFKQRLLFQLKQTKPFKQHLKSLSILFPQQIDKLFQHFDTIECTNNSFFDYYSSQLTPFINNHIKQLELLYNSINTTPSSTTLSSTSPSSPPPQQQQSHNTTIKHCSLGQGIYKPSIRQRRVVCVINNNTDISQLKSIVDLCLFPKYQFQIHFTSPHLYYQLNQDICDLLQQHPNDIQFIPLSNITSINYYAIIIPTINIPNNNINNNIHHDQIIDKIASFEWISMCPIVNKLLNEFYIHGKPIIDLSTLLSPNTTPFLSQQHDDSNPNINKPPILNLIPIQETYNASMITKLIQDDNKIENVSNDKHENTTNNTNNTNLNPLCLCRYQLRPGHSICCHNYIVHLTNANMNNIQQLIHDIEYIFDNQIGSEFALQRIPEATNYLDQLM